MRLICPNCDAQYEVADSAIPEDGRDVQCSNCSQTWFQKSASMLEQEASEAEALAKLQQTPKAQPDIEQATIEEPASENTETAPQSPLESPPPERELKPQSPSKAALDILREEAEIAARSREGQPSGGIEIQPDLGLDTPSKPAPQEHIVHERQANLQDVAIVDAPPKSRRDLLPDIEEINSTLRATTDRQDLLAETGNLSSETRRQRRRGFRFGFGLVLLLTAIAIVLYVYTPQIIAKYPQTQSLLGPYVESVNEMRNWLETIMEKATDSMTESQ